MDSDGEAAVENITPAEARQAALTRARLKAVESAIGIEVQGLTIVKDFGLVADFIRTLSSGHVVEEKELSWDSRTLQEKPDSPPMLSVSVKLRTCVAKSAGEDPFFKVKGELNRPVFMAGEDASITASCTKDCWLTILNVTADNKVSILYPNSYEPARLVRSGDSLTFPSTPGLALEMGTLPGHKKDSEAFFLIATKDKFDLSGIANKSGEVAANDLYKTLFALPAGVRAEEMLIYEVRAKE